MKDKITWQSPGSDVVHEIPAHAVVTFYSKKSVATVEIDGDNIQVTEYAHLRAPLEKFLIKVGLKNGNQ